MRIAVLGAGSWGTTVASLLAGHNDCTVWARDPELAREIYERDANSRYLPGFALPSNLKATADLEKAVHDVDLLVVGVPTHGFRVILTDVRPYLRPWIPVVSLSKGFERGSLLRMTQLIKDELPGHPPAALTGPNLAKEIMAGEAATFSGLAGMGDLIATCMSPMSRNRTLGEQLGAGKTLDEILGATRTVAEGVGTAFTVHELAERHNMEMPVCREVYRVLNGEIPASEAYRGLRIQAGHEREPG